MPRSSRHRSRACRTPHALGAYLGDARLGRFWLPLSCRPSRRFVVVLIWRPDAIMSGGADLLKDGPLISRHHRCIGGRADRHAGAGGAARALARRRVSRAGAAERSRPALIAIAIMIVFLLGYDALTYLIGRDVVTPFQVDTYRSARDGGTLPAVVDHLRDRRRRSPRRSCSAAFCSAAGSGPTQTAMPGHPGDLVAVCGHPCAIRLVRHPAGVLHRPPARHRALAQRLDRCSPS